MTKKQEERICSRRKSENCTKQTTTSLSRPRTDDNMRVEDIGQWKVVDSKAVSSPKFFPGSTDYDRNSSSTIIVVVGSWTSSQLARLASF